MKVFVVVEMLDIELHSLRTFFHPEHANEVFEAIVMENDLQECEGEDLRYEIPDTIRLAGDDAYSVQLLESDVVMAPHMTKAE